VNVTTPAAIAHTPAEEGSTVMTTWRPEVDVDAGTYVPPTTKPVGGVVLNAIV
jgi:hypothetical protein